MNTQVASMDQNSQDFAIEKVRWIAAHEYASYYGMTVVEAFFRTVISEMPNDVCVSFDIGQYKSMRELQTTDETWMFDRDVVLSLDEIFRNRMNLRYSDNALKHMFPSDLACQMILSRAQTCQTKK